MTLPGFDPIPDPPKLSAGQRLTQRKQAALNRGVNPGSGREFREGAYTCGQCFHAIAKGGRKNFWKCEMGHLSNSAASDIRLKWPACVLFSTKDDGKSRSPKWVTRAPDGNS